MMLSPVPKQSPANSKQNLSCRDVFCVLQINRLCDNVVQLPKPQDYICLPDDLVAGNNDLCACEIYVTPRNPAPSDLSAFLSIYASFHYDNLVLKIFPIYVPSSPLPAAL